MPVPTVITDLSPTLASNSPAGTDVIGNNLDDYLRAAFGFIAQNYANKAVKGENTDITSLTALASINTSFLTGLAEDTNPLLASDYLFSYDASAAAYKKILPKNLFSGQNVVTSAVNATTYDVSALAGFPIGLLFLTNATNRTVTNFTNAVSGQVLIVINDATATTVTVDRSNAYLNGSANQALASQDALILVKQGTFWYQVAPISVNG